MHLLYFLLLISCIIIVTVLLVPIKRDNYTSISNDTLTIKFDPRETEKLEKGRIAFEKKFSIVSAPMLLSWKDTNRLRHTKGSLARIYLNDIYEHYKSMSRTERKPIVVVIGDNMKNQQLETSYLAKSRWIGDDKVILQRWNAARHWNNFKKVRFLDTPWKNKLSKVIWRGVSTGKEDRMLFAKMYAQHSNKNFDIGLSKIVQGQHTSKKFVKSFRSMRKQLKYKYIVCIEGNDVASGLKWILASKSVCFMKRPTKESWLREGQLIPGYHYVELNHDFSNLEEKYEWAISHEKECLDIQAHANEYMRQFENEKKQNALSKMIFRKYVRELHET